MLSSISNSLLIEIGVSFMRLYGGISNFSFFERKNHVSRWFLRVRMSYNNQKARKLNLLHVQIIGFDEYYMHEKFLARIGRKLF